MPHWRRLGRASLAQPPLKAHREPPLPFLTKCSGSILKDSGCKVEFVIWAVVWYLVYWVRYLLLVFIISIVIVHRSKYQGYLKCVITCSLNKYSHQGTPDEVHDWRLPQKGWSQNGPTCIDNSWNRKFFTEQIWRGFGMWRRMLCVSNISFCELCSCWSLMGDSEPFKKAQLDLKDLDEWKDAKTRG